MVQVLVLRYGESRSPVYPRAQRSPGARRGPRPWATPGASTEPVFKSSKIYLVMGSRPDPLDAIEESYMRSVGVTHLMQLKKIT